MSVPKELVEKKLSGIYGSFNVEVSWDIYEGFLMYCKNCLDNHYDCVLDTQYIITKRAVMNAFEKDLQAILERIARHPENYVDWDVDAVLKRTFKAEIDKAQQERFERMQLEEQKRLQHLASKTVNGKVQLEVDPADYNKVVSLLNRYQIVIS